MPQDDHPYRSVLYMPGSRPRALEKARSLPADALILDLEDAVAPAEKPKARELVAEAVAAGGYGRRKLLVRVNGLDTEWGEADLARDLRRIVRERVQAGDDDAAVMRFVHDRYGDFVLLRPPFNPVTALLWAMPLIAFGGGLAVILTRRRRAGAAEPPPLTEVERQRLAELDGGGA